MQFNLQNVMMFLSLALAILIYAALLSLILRKR